MQNRAARRINFHHRDRSPGISAENLSRQLQILSGIPINFPLQIQISGSKRNSVIISATTVHKKTTLTLQSLLFSISLLFSLSDFPCFFGAFFLSFPRISGVPQREQLLLFSWVSLAFSKKQGLEGQGI